MTPKIFISHRWNYSDDYYNLETKLKQRNFECMNYSVPEHDPFDSMSNNSLKEKIDEQIRQCSVYITFVNQAMDNSSWVQYELKVAMKYGKPILGVKPWSYNGVIPLLFQQNCKEIIGFNTDNIIRKIEDYIK